jgi:Ulp1 family protease
MGQAWLDGHQSIIDWRGGERIDFWAIMFWREMSMVITKQKEWCYAHSRFQSTKQGTGLPDNTKISVEELINNLGWNVPLPILQAVQSDELTAFFGTRWLNDNHIDMMVEEMNGHITTSPNLVGRVAVAPAFFVTDIMTISKASHARSALLSRYEKSVKEGKVRMIYCPVNVHNNHWIMAYIDIQNSRVGYGE